MAIRIESDIEHDDLNIDTEDDGGDDEPTTSVHISIFAHDGMRYGTNAAMDGEIGAAEVANLLYTAVMAAARMHSLDVPELLRRRMAREA